MPTVPTATHFIYDREDVILDFEDADGVAGPNAPVLVKRYLHGPGPDMILAQEDLSGGGGVTGDVLWLFTDHLGTTRDILDNNGNLLNHIQYDSFGNILTQSDPSVVTRYLYTGREFETELDLYYYRARFYDPSLGKFIQQDPIGFVDGTNYYEYVGSSPIMLTDPSGMIAPLLVGAIVFGVGVFVIDDVAEAPTVHTTSEEMAAHKRANDQKNAAVLGAVILSPFELADAIENVWDVLSDPFGTLSDPLFPVALCTPLTAKQRKLLRRQGTEQARQNVAKTIEQNAADLVTRNGGRNRVSIQTPNGRVNVDLQGRSHGGVDTPHVTEFRDNVIPSGPRAGQVGNRSQVGPTREATNADLRNVDRVLQSRGQ